MIRTRFWSALAAATLLAAAAIAQPGHDAARPGAPKNAPKAGDAAAQPSGDQMAAMTAMMEASMKAATPGKMHEFLAKGVGTWEGVIKHWPMPGMDAMEMPCTTVVKPMFDGRYFAADVTSDMGEMGQFKGLGIYAYDNVSEKFQNIWIDSMGTGIMTGAGVLGSDGKTLTWTMTCHDPVTKKPMTLRQVDRHTSDTTSVMEMYGPGPDGKEFKMMEINYSRKSGPGNSPDHARSDDHAKSDDHSKSHDHKPDGKPAKK